MSDKVQLWLKGAAAALVMGAGGAAENAVLGLTIAPDTFNLHEGLGRLGTLVIAGVLYGGASGLFAYLKRSPLPGVKPEMAQ